MTRPRYITTMRDGDVPHDREIVRDEEVGQAALALQRFQQIDDLALDRHVERRHRLVADDEFRFDRKRARNADALALAAGKLVRIAVGHFRPQAHFVEQGRDPLARRCAVRCETIDRAAARPMIWPMVMRGLSERIGVLKHRLDLAAHRS